MVEATIPQQQQQQNHQRKLEHYPKTVQLHNHDLANDWRVQQPAVPSTQSTFSMLNPTIGTRLDDLWIGNGNGNGRHKIQQQQQPHRLLGNSNDNNAFQSVFVDADGNAYEPYALAWRYLGMYMDCDMYDEEEEAENENGKERQRHLSNDSDDGECTRKLLWAAYLDPGYLGGAIGEYQFLDRETELWNKTTCHTQRCARMDCHDPHSHFKLLGVYKETDGLADWAEQLFKHHGYCQWDEDTYDSMQTYRESWPTTCTALYYPDSDGNKLYSGLRPLAEGNITIGVYLNDQCTTDSGHTWADYIMIYYSSYYYSNSETGRTVAAKWENAIQIWNDAMMVYKSCQPCRTYNLFPDEEQSSHDSKEGRDRFLADDNEGEGSAEPWGYDCNDDAGYLNCNQCYKFETKTDMELADMSDLQRATKQGTILHIKMNGTEFGMGGYESFYLAPQVIVERVAAVCAIVIAVVVGLAAIRRFCSFKILNAPPPQTKGDYKAHSEELPNSSSNNNFALSNKFQAVACNCDVGPVSTEVRVLVQKYPMYRD